MGSLGEHAACGNDAASFAVYNNIRLGSESGESDYIALLHRLRPEWRGENITSKTIKPGFVNRMFCYYLADDVAMNDALVVRVYGQVAGEDGMSGEQLLSRNNETLGFQVGELSGATPTLLATFQNGLVYTYSPGRQINPRDLLDTKILTQIGRRVADFHGVAIEKHSFFGCNGEPAKFSTYPEVRYFRGILSRFARAPKQLRDAEENSRYEELIFGMYEEILLVKNMFSEMGFQTGLCHNDTYWRNIVYDDKADRITLIDLELVENNLVVYDLAVSFGLLPYSNFNGFADGTDLTNRSDLWDLMVEAYVRRKYECVENSDNNVDHIHKEIEQLKIQFHMLVMSYSLYWFANVVATADTHLFPDVDTLANMELCRRNYFGDKERMLDLHKTYMTKYHHDK